MKKSTFAALVLPLPIVLAGCGGGGGGGANPGPYTVIFERSPNGSQATTDIFAMNGNGGGLTNLTNTSGFDGFPSVDTNGTIVTFESTRSGVSKIYTMGIDGSNQTAVSQDNAYGARLSADGSKIVYVVGTTTGEIWIMNADGSGQTQLTTNAADDGNPTFTSDGAHVIFESNRDGTYQIYSMDTAGGSVTRLTNNSTDDTNPTVSPDGTKIAFVRWNGSDDDLYVMDLNGANQTRLTTSTRNDSEPVYSPDGAKIFYSSGTSSSAIRKINVDGTGDAQVISGGKNFQPAVAELIG